MQATARCHDGVTHAVRHAADVILHAAIAFPPTKGVCNAEAAGGAPAIGRVLRRGEWPTPGCLRGWDDRDAGPDEALAPHILLESPPAPPGCARGPSLHRWHARSHADRSPRSRGGVCARGTSACHGKTPAVPRHPAGDGGVAPDQPAHQGERGPILRLLAGQARGARASGASRQPRVPSAGLMPHGMQERPPLVRLRVRPPHTLAWHCLDGMLLHGGPHEAPLVSQRGSGRGGRRRVAAAGARLPRKGVLFPVGQNRGFDRRQQCRACLRSEAGHGPSTPSPWGDLRIAGPSHLRHAGMGLWAMRHGTP